MRLGLIGVKDEPDDRFRDCRANALRNGYAAAVDEGRDREHMQKDYQDGDNGAPQVAFALRGLHARALRQDDGEVRWFACDRTVRHANACSNPWAVRAVTAIKF